MVLITLLFNIACIELTHGSDSPGEIPVCYDFSCKTQSWVQLNEQDWRQVQGLFYLNADAQEERKRIQQAVAIMEKIIGTYTPTFQDVALNWSSQFGDIQSGSGQMDCIDESINTTTYLELLEKSGLLKFHKVLNRAYRRSLFRQHWAGQIVDVQSNQRYIIDSWFEKNGELPIMVRGEVWHNLSLF